MDRYVRESAPQVIDALPGAECCEHGIALSSRHHYLQFAFADFLGREGNPQLETAAERKSARVQHECSTSAASAAQLHYKCSTIALQVQHNCSTIVAQVQRKCSTSAARTYHGQHTELTRHSSNLSVAVLITSLACYHQTLCTYSGAAQGLIIATTHPSLSTLSVSLQPTTQLKEQPITQLKERTITAAYLYQWRCAVIQK